MDSSVVLATLFGETRRPDAEFWRGPRLASRLTDLEVRVRAADRFLGEDDEGRANLGRLLSRVRLVEITARTVELLYRTPPRHLRTLDAVHLATFAHVRTKVPRLALATYDRRLSEAAQAMGFQVIVP